MAYQLPWYDDRDRFAEPLGDRWRFTAQDYTLSVALAVENNYAAEALVRRAVEAVDPGLAERIEFESEYGCFFAHTDTRGDMEALAAIVNAMVDAVSPDAQPGTIWDSPAAFRYRDSLS